jgi:hypothetical protein
VNVASGYRRIHKNSRADDATHHQHRRIEQSQSTRQTSFVMRKMGQAIPFCFSYKLKVLV